MTPEMEGAVHLLRCLLVSLCVYPAMAYTATPESGVPAAEGSAVAPAESAPSDALATEAVEAWQAVLKQRVMARWDALIRRDFEAAYSFTSPSYRALFPLNVFKSKFGNKVAWRRVEVVTIEPKGEDAATVGIDLHVGYHQPQSEQTLEMKTYIKEPWVRVDGQWWYVMKD
ncbi:MAG: hypothetical protein KDJ34_18105 [Candidatus Competibacteraceae bacterium]|nr:hypothetical protein [Candidatus Competibacteraceae bacterium]MCP5132377.1 hypothetical protein [Gammaproteobacteria bacterium]